MVAVRRTDGRRLDGYTISSSCEPNGSGELIKLSEEILGQPEYFVRRCQVRDED